MMAMAVKRGLSVKAVAARFGARKKFVVKACREFRVTVPFSHEHRRAQRREMARMVRSGQTVKDVAAQFGVSQHLVVRGCRESGVRLTRGRPKGYYLDRGEGATKVTHSRWQATDWRQRDADIARRYGVSRERVRQVRKMLGLGSSRDLYRRVDRLPADRERKRRIRLRKAAMQKQR
jgi:transposase-like protein